MVLVVHQLIPRILNKPEQSYVPFIYGLHSQPKYLDRYFLTSIGMCPKKMQLQLQSLMETLSSTEPHYIRCVKPNNVLKPAIFENLNVIQQLRCGVSIIHIYLLLCFCFSFILCNLPRSLLFYNPVYLVNFMCAYYLL